MKRLVVVADDFGLSSGINKGVIESIEKGIVTEPSLMVWCPGTDEAIDKIKDMGYEQLGIHITLNNFIASSKYLRNADYEKLLNNTTEENLRKLVLAELSEFERLVGNKPTHITSHHNVHLHPKIIDCTAHYANDNGIPVRKTNDLESGKGLETIEKAKTTDYIFSHIKGSYQETFDDFLNDLATVEEGKTVEIFFHPGYVDEIVSKYSSLTNDRERDLKLATNQDFRTQIEKMGFKICNYSNIF